METHISYTVVGIFVISLLTAIILGIIWLSSGFSLEQYKTYLVYIKESVSGLNIDSPVEYNGVDVGAVKKIQLNNKNPQLVELLLNIKSNTPITHGTVATLNIRGVTGNTYLALKDKSTDLRPLMTEPGHPYPIIPSAPSLFTRLDTALQQVSENLQKVTASIGGVFDKGNQQSIKATLIHLEKITHSLVNNNQHMINILRNSEKASAQISPLLQSSTQAAKTLELQTLPAAYRLINQLNDTAHSLSQVTHDIKQNPSILIRGQIPIQGPGESP